MQKPIKFWKMHGLGNDFVVIDTLTQDVSINALPIKELAHRHTGIGFDQLLLIGKSDNADFSCRIFNSDGSEAEQCGNGMRCVTRYIQESKLSSKNKLSIETKAGIVEAIINDFDHIQVNMGTPTFDAPCDIELDDNSYKLTIVSMGNPHAILPVDTIKTFPISNIGPKISTHSIFPHGTNVGFMEVVDRGHIRLRTFERGSGETLACGSNACAAVVAGIQNGLLDNKVKVELLLGDLWIEWTGKDMPVLMIGPAAAVFEGRIA